MELNKDTKIKYYVKDKNDDVVTCIFTLEQIEGSIGGFYKDFKEFLRDIDDFDIDNSEIIKREIVDDVVTVYSEN